MPTPIVQSPAVATPTAVDIHAHDDTPTTTRLTRAPERRVLLVDQNLPMAAAVADRVHGLSRGEIVDSGTPAALMADETVKSRCLGVA
jgi:ABC-type branched-subunit amino acid transport system ATPase component